MKRIALFVLAALVILLTACTRAYSNAPEMTPTAISTITPTATATPLLVGPVELVTEVLEVTFPSNVPLGLRNIGWIEYMNDSDSAPADDQEMLLGGKLDLMDGWTIEVFQIAGDPVDWIELRYMQGREIMYVLRLDLGNTYRFSDGVVHIVSGQQLGSQYQFVVRPK